MVDFSHAEKWKEIFLSKTYTSLEVWKTKQGISLSRFNIT